MSIAGGREVTTGSVNEHKVNVVHLKSSEVVFQLLFGGLVALIRSASHAGWRLGGEEERVTVLALQRFANTLLVVVVVRGVDVCVPKRKSLGDGISGGLVVVLPNAECHKWHLNAIRELDGGVFEQGGGGGAEGQRRNERKLHLVCFDDGGERRCEVKTRKTRKTRGLYMELSASRF